MVVFLFDAVETLKYTYVSFLDENDPSVETPTFSTSKLNRPYLNTFLSLMNRLVSDGLQGPLNCHLRFLSYLFDLNYTDATPAIRLRLCRNIVDFV